MYVYKYILHRMKKSRSTHSFSTRRWSISPSRDSFTLHLAALRDRPLSYSLFRKCNEISVTPIAACGPLYLNIIRIGNSRESMPRRAAFKCAARSKIAARAPYLDGSRMTLDLCSSPIGGSIACLSPIEYLLSVRKLRTSLVADFRRQRDRSRYVYRLDRSSWQHWRSFRWGEIVESIIRFRGNERFQPSSIR